MQVYQTGVLEFNKGGVNNHYKHLDHYGRMAKKHGYRSRAAWKLIQIDERYNVTHGVTSAVDLGCAPGGWLQVLRKRLPRGSRLVGLDIAKVNPVAGAEIILGDAEDASVMDQIAIRKPQLVVSDMAPGTTGYTELDHRNSIGLCYVAFEFALKALQHGGNFVCKVFMGADDQQLYDDIRPLFTTLKRFKPDASRDQSRETYFVAMGKLG
jgi:23S rRNA (uridine2552-2'-O)-methyltransferase